MGKYCINKSGKAIGVYSAADCTSGKIGTIYANECYALMNTWAGSHVFYPNQTERIYFRNSSGALQEGYIYNDGTGMATSFLNYSFGSVTVDGTAYKSFKTRAALSYYDKNGNYKGKCTAGARVLTNDSTPGQSMPYLMNAMYVETGVGTNRWVLISSVKGQSGFIDTGIRSGSMSTNIDVYGNW